MTRSKPNFLSLTLAAGCLAAFSFAARAEQITVEAFGYLPEADVVILGEAHDNPVHHLHQAIAVDALGIKALVFEMLEADQALKITPELRASEALLGAALEWERSGWPEFGMYYPIFTAGGGLPVFGGAIDRAEVRRAVTDGAAEVFGGAASIFGLDSDLPEDEQAAREIGQAEAHCNALPEDLLGGMVEAQRLRDAGLAQAVLAALAETGGPIAVITGNGHAHNSWGVPAALAIAAPDVSVITIGQLEGEPSAPPPFDFWFVTDGVDRGDPCEAFRNR